VPYSRLLLPCALVGALIFAATPALPDNGAPDAHAWRASLDAGVKARKAAKYADATQQLTAAVKEAERFGPQDARLVQSLNELGTALRMAQRSDEAKAAHHRALTIAEAAKGKANPEVASALYGLAVIASGQDHADDAEALFKRALAIREKALGRESPEVAHALYGYGYFKIGQQDFGQARTMLTRALAIYDKNVGEEADIRALTVLSLANLDEQANQVSAATAAYARALAEGEKAFPTDHPTLAWIRVNVAEFKFAMQEADGAVTLFEQAIPVMAAAEGSNEQQLAGYKADWAAAYYAQKKYVESEHLYAESLPILEKVMSKDDPNLKSARETYEQLKAYNAAQASGTAPKYETRYVNGTMFQVATHGDLQVWMACWKGSEIQSMLYVVNGSDHPITFFPEQAQLEAVRKDGQRSQLKTFSADQYERKVSNANAWKAFAIALGQSGQNQPQPQTTTVSGRYNTNVYGSGYTEYGSYYGTITRWPTQADYAEAEARNRARTEAMLSQLSSSFRAMSSTLMRTHTLDPHSYYGGTVYMNQSGKNYVMTVPFGGTSFQFSFSFN
jgi:tetratricopeptide (TPR) repeat protein